MTVSIPTTYNHGARRIEDDSGPRPVVTLDSATIGIVGTAPGADVDLFPLNTPVAILGDETMAAKLGATGTLPDAIALIYAQVLCRVVVVRVEEGADEEATITNVIGGVPPDGSRQGLAALRHARAITGLWPRLLLAPGFSHHQSVLTAMVPVANALRGWIFPDGPNTTSQAAMAYRALFSSRRIIGIFDPWLVVRADDGSEKVVPSSPVAAGLAIKRHYEKGFWWSASNQVANGVIGTARPIDFTMGDPSCEQNTLNEHQVNTWVMDGGVRLWGDDTCSDDTKWRFFNVVAADDMIGDSLVDSYKRLVDANIDRNFFDEWAEQTRAYLRDMKNKGALIGFRVWLSGELNSPTNLAMGQTFLHYDYRSPTPARDVIAISRLANEFFTELFKGGL